MAKDLTPEEKAALEEKTKLQDEKKKLKKEQKEQKKEAKRRAKEIAKQEDALAENEDGNGLAAFGATILIVVLWLAVICVVIKMDVGGFGSSVVTPILKDVPVLNKILPGTSLTETTDGESYGGYTSLQDAVDYIRQLELELERSQTLSSSMETELTNLRAEVLRLQEFEKKQVEFQRIMDQFYEEVVYTENGPGAEEYQKYYEKMNPTTAESLYKQVVEQRQESEEVQQYAQSYADMKPAAAAKIFEKMQSDLKLVARILNTMDAESRGDILAAMDAEVAAKLTKIMDPES